MKESEIAKGFRTLGYDALNFISNNRAHIYTAVGIGGTIATGIAAAQSGARAARKIDRRRRELERDLTFGEKFQLCWSDAVIPVATCALACFSDFKSDQINTKTIADRTVALIASEKAYEKLSQKTKEVLGEKKAKQVQDEIAKEEMMQPGYITQQKLDEAPRVGNGELYPFVDLYTGLLFWSNIDYIDCCIMKLQKMMAELKPRDPEYDYNDKIVGIPYSEWLAFLGFNQKVYSTPERRGKGWNKGFNKDGSDDDPIDYVRRPIEWRPGFSVTGIDWIKDPSDMKMGRLMKSSGL